MRRQYNDQVPLVALVYLTSGVDFVKTALILLRGVGYTCLGARPRYSLVVNEDVKKTNQTKNEDTLA